MRWCNVVPFQAAGQEALALAADPPSLGIGGRPSHFGGEVGGEPAAASLPMPPRVLDAHVMKSKLLASPYAFLANMARCRAKAVDAEFGTRFAPKLKEGARFGGGKARRVQTCSYYDALGAPKPPFQWGKRYLAPRAIPPSRVCDRPRIRGVGWEPECETSTQVCSVARQNDFSSVVSSCSTDDERYMRGTDKTDLSQASPR